MATSLQNETPAAAYGQLLHVDGGVTSTPKVVYGGDGTATGLQISTTGITVGDVSEAEIQHLNGVSSAIQGQLDSKQATLISATNIKTINSNSLLGSGDIVISGGTVSPVACRIYRATNQSIPTGAGYTDVSFSNAAYEVNGEFWTSGATVTIPETGYYQIFAEGTFDGSGLLATATANMQVLLNGTTTILEDERTVAINGKPSLMGTAQRSFTAGDTLKMQVKHSEVGSLNLLAQGDHSPDIIVTKLTGAKGDTGAGASDGDKGDIVISGTGTVYTIDSNSLNAIKALTPAANKIVKYTSASAAALASFIDNGVVSDTSAPASTVFTGTLAPSGTINYDLSWQQIGTRVSVIASLYYSVAGSALTNITFDFPAGMPAPVERGGFSAASIPQYIGRGYAITTTVTTLSNGATFCGIRRNAADNAFEITSQFSSGSYRAFLIQFEYDTAG